VSVFIVRYFFSESEQSWECISGLQWFGDHQTLLSLNCAAQGCSNPILRYIEFKHLSKYLAILHIL